MNIGKLSERADKMSRQMRHMFRSGTDPAGHMIGSMFLNSEGLIIGENSRCFFYYVFTFSRFGTLEGVNSIYECKDTIF